jgi:hypothetical protein
MKPTQANMFAGTNEDLPMFSGTAIPTPDDSFRELETAYQITMLCPTCMGTGYVILNGKKVSCTCGGNYG